MPYIDIRLAGITLTQTQRDALFERVTALMTTVMGKRRDVTAVSIDERDGTHWAVGGTALTETDAPGAYVDIKVTQGTNTITEKAAMIAETTTMLEDIVGTLQAASYVVIHEIAGDAWGYGGLTQGERTAKRVT